MKAIETILSREFIDGLNLIERVSSIPYQKITHSHSEASQIFAGNAKGDLILKPSKGPLAKINKAFRVLKNELSDADSNQLAGLYVCANKWRLIDVYADAERTIGNGEQPGLLVLIKGEFLKRHGNSQAMFDTLTEQYGGEDFNQIPNLANRPMTSDSTKPDSVHRLLFRNNYREALYENKRVFEKARICAQTSMLSELHQAHTKKTKWLRWSDLKKKYGITKDNPTDLMDRRFVSNFMDVKKVSSSTGVSDWMLRFKPTLEVESS